MFCFSVLLFCRLKTFYLYFLFLLLFSYPFSFLHSYSSSIPFFWIILSAFVVFHIYLFCFFLSVSLLVVRPSYSLIEILFCFSVLLFSRLKTFYLYFLIFVPSFRLLLVCCIFILSLFLFSGLYYLSFFMFDSSTFTFPLRSFYFNCSLFSIFCFATVMIVSSFSFNFHFLHLLFIFYPVFYFFLTYYHHFFVYGFASLNSVLFFSPIFILASYCNISPILLMLLFPFQFLYLIAVHFFNGLIRFFVNILLISFFFYPSCSHPLS